MKLDVLSVVKYMLHEHKHMGTHTHIYIVSSLSKHRLEINTIYVYLFLPFFLNEKTLKLHCCPVLSG
jgi:hypothetical protein